MIELYILLIFTIIAAIVAIETRDLLSSVIAVGAAGLGVTTIFLVLKAPDVAITQLVVEILCLIILIRAALKRDLPFSTSGRWYLNTAITGIFIVVFFIVVMKCLKDLPDFGYPIMKVASTYIRDGLAKTGAIVADELAELLEVWDKASFSTLEDSIVYHADKHFSGDIIGMLRKASNFNTRGARKIRHSDGSIRYQKGNGEYIMKRDGKIISYGYN